jgi:hypothetical protein
MFFALGMERVEARLRQVAVGETDVEEFLEQARPNEVRALFRFGIGRALELVRLRRRPLRTAPPIMAEEQTVELSPINFDMPTERIVRPRPRSRAS